MSNYLYFKSGATFDQIVDIPLNFADGFFDGWAATSEVRARDNTLLGTLTCSWVDATTRQLKLTQTSTASWPEGEAKFDVKLRRVSDGFTIYTETVPVWITSKVTA